MLQAVLFASEQPAGEAYAQGHEATFTTENELSAYRFMLEHIWYVAVLGEKLPEELE